MDAIQSPRDDGFLTLPGQDSKGHGAGGDRSKSPSPSPSFSLFSSSHVKTQPAKHNQHERQQLQQQQREVGSVESFRSVESLPARGRLQQAGRKERETSRSISPRYTYIVDPSCLYYYSGTEGDRGRGSERLIIKSHDTTANCVTTTVQVMTIIFTVHLFSQTCTHNYPSLP